MKARVKLHYTEYTEIDLEDYGHNEDTRYEDLNEDDQAEILDHLRSEVVVFVDVETIKDY